MKVVKRDGRNIDFNKQKIVDAVCAAYKEVDGEISDDARSKAIEIADAVERLDKDLGVEQIQDIIENKLMASKRKDVAKQFIKYREERTKIRESKATWMQLVAEKIKASNVQNQNANVDEHSFGGRKGEADSVLMRKIALEYLMSDLARRNHENNEIYTHDLDSYAVGMSNCLTIPFDKLLAEGFNTRQTDVRPAQSINTAFQLVAVIFQLQSLQQFGGVSASHLDWTMVPYVRKSFSKHMKDGLRYVEGVTDEDYINSVPDELSFDDLEANDARHAKAYQYAMDMTTKETYQAVEGMYHNLNVIWAA
ncbi:MAG: anaerobic ribonucleoside-triphosphate reductase [Prevotella sp.]|nr:anaerobic ribonucleoside-triphosphate reductase [Prevotella sp.]